MSYSLKVIDHYENPRNVGSLDQKDANVGTGLVGAPACGDVMKLQIRVGKDGVIEEAKFKAYGCGSAIAASSLGTELIKGKNIAEAISIKNTDIADELELPPVKLHCSMLVEQAIKAALLDYEKKQQALQPQLEEEQKLSCKDIKSVTPEIPAKNLADSATKHQRADYVAITALAAAKMKEKLAEGTDTDGFRIWVSSGGCSGKQYNMQYAQYGKNISKFDDVLEVDGTKLFIDNNSVMFFIGLTIDYHQDDLTEEFKFINPNEKSRCGCQKSFN